MSYFGLKSQIFFKNGEWGIKYFKLKGRQKSLEGRMQSAGRTLAMSAINQLITLSVSLGVSICLDRVSIESLDLDTGKKEVPIVEKILTVTKSLP
jgi:hypothetical protein